RCPHLAGNEWQSPLTVNRLGLFLTNSQHLYLITPANVTMLNVPAQLAAAHTSLSAFISYHTSQCHYVEYSCTASRCPHLVGNEWQAPLTVNRLGLFLTNSQHLYLISPANVESSRCPHLVGNEWQSPLTVNRLGLFPTNCQHLYLITPANITMLNVPAQPAAAHTSLGLFVTNSQHLYLITPANVTMLNVPAQPAAAHTSLTGVVSNELSAFISHHTSQCHYVESSCAASRCRHLVGNEWQAPLTVNRLGLFLTNSQHLYLITAANVTMLNVPAQPAAVQPFS
ncbi:hypothetical protein J6590_106521, partial [Homalodisca vitripennis]